MIGQAILGFGVVMMVLCGLVLLIAGAPQPLYTGFGFAALLTAGYCFHAYVKD